MNTLTIKSWCKPQGAERSIQMGDLHFHVNDADHLLLEQAEERLQKTHEDEVMIDAQMEHMELITPSECGSLSDLQFRVFLSKDDDRGLFHLVGHRESDGSLVYTNTVMIDQLG